MDREKVIRALECTPYMTINGVKAADIIELLKKPEPVPPKIYPETRYSGPLIACGDCRHELDMASPKFCPFCGKPINWKELHHES